MKFPMYKLRINEEDPESGVTFVALVDSPAIEKSFVAFDLQKDFFKIEDTEKRIVSGPLMVANLPIYRRDQEHGEYYVVADKEVISQIVHKFFRNQNNKNVNLSHDATQIADGVYMFESFIIDRARGVNPPIGYEKLSDGSWFGSFKVNNDTIWEKIKAGEFTGFSIEGMFNHEFVGDPDKVLIDNIRQVLLKELNRGNENCISNNKTKTMLLNLDEKIKEKMEAIKALFSAEPTVEMTDAKLSDGVTIISYEGKTPEAGQKVYTIDASGKNPAADGDYELADGTTLTVTGGVIMDVKKLDAPVEPVAATSQEPVVSNVQSISRDEFEIFSKKSNGELMEIRTELKRVEGLNKSLFEVIENLVKIPDSDPTVKPTTPFSKGKDKNDRILELSKQLNNLKK